MLQPPISLCVFAGETLLVQGPNGAGKTSLLRAVAGFLDVPRGCISFRMQGDVIVADAEERVSNVGWLGHLDGVKTQFSLLENLQFHCRYHRHTGDVDNALASFGLSRLRHLPTQYLSHGQRRRLAFARLLVVPRPVWLLDEPFSAMDARGKECIRREIKHHCANGGIVVAATHEPLGVSSASLELA